jgi:hypothetical protein
MTSGGVGVFRRALPNVVNEREGVTRNLNTSTVPSASDARKKFES